MLRFCVLLWFATESACFITLYYSDVIMSEMASQITSVYSVYSTVFRRRSKKISKLRVTGLCEGNSPVIGEFPSQKASNAENVSIWWCHHGSYSSAFASVKRNHENTAYIMDMYHTEGMCDNQMEQDKAKEKKWAVFMDIVCMNTLLQPRQNREGV